MAAGADEETSETSAGGGRTPLTMAFPAAVLTAGGLIVTLGPGFGRAVVSAALRFRTRPGTTQESWAAPASGPARD